MFVQTLFVPPSFIFAALLEFLTVFLLIKYLSGILKGGIGKNGSTVAVSFSGFYVIFPLTHLFTNNSLVWSVTGMLSKFGLIKHSLFLSRIASLYRFIML